MGVLWLGEHRGCRGGAAFTSLLPPKRQNQAGWLLANNEVRTSKRDRQ